MDKMYMMGDPDGNDEAPDLDKIANEEVDHEDDEPDDEEDPDEIANRDAE